MALPIVVIGAATALLEIVDLIGAINAREPTYEIVGALDDDPSLKGSTVGGIRILGDLTLARTMPEMRFVFAISSYRLRLQRIAILDDLGVGRDRFVTLVHPAADISPTIRIGHRCTIYSNAFIATQCTLGDFVIVYNSCVVSPYCELEAFSMIAGLAFLGANVHLCEGAFVGGSAAVASGVRIGRGGMAGLGSGVFRDVPPGIFVLGNPAKAVRALPTPLNVPDDDL